jgi:hypothetical protein
MEKEFYLEINGARKGPISKLEIKKLAITPQTLIWFEGLEDWKMIKDVPELKDVLKSIPPPLPINKNSNNEKKVLVEKPDPGITWTGVFLILSVLLINYLYPINEDNRTNHWFFIIVFILGLIIRILSIFWVVSIAEKLNRNSFVWGALCFISPGLSLIIIGQLRKLNI